MRIIPIAFIVFLLSATGCKSNKTFTVYSISPDSVVYLDAERFDTQALIKGIQTDQSFMETLRKNISESKSDKVYKPIAGDNGEGDIGTSIKNVKDFLRDNNIDAQMEETDSIEKSYFRGMSLLEIQRMVRKDRMEVSLPPPPAPPTALIISPPTSVVTMQDMSQPMLDILLKKNGDILYKFGTVPGDKDYKKIIPATTAQIKLAFDNLERENGFKLDTMEQRILIHGQNNAPTKSFKAVKGAFVAKEIYKFRLVTTEK